MSEPPRYKIVVLGLYNAGKTCLIHLLDQNTKSVEAPVEEGTTTVAIDFGKFSLDGVELLIFGTPGQDRFEVVREIAAIGAVGAIIIIDGCQGITEWEAKIAERFEDGNIPYIILLNKTDIHPQIRDVVSKSESEKIFAASAITGEGIIPALRSLIRQLITSD